MPHRVEHDALLESELYADRSPWWSPFYWFQWKPTSLELLLEAEQRMLCDVAGDVHCRFVRVAGGQMRLRTVTIDRRIASPAPIRGPASPATSPAPHMPLVMLHGMGSGVGLWALNLSALATHRTVHALDLPGFGASSRLQFPIDAREAEMSFVDSLDEWREAVGLNRFILLGHSLGGFLATAYAIKHPERVAHLILVDPWGFAERPADIERRTPQPTWVKLVTSAMQVFNPFAPLRAVGPFGSRLVSFFRPDLIRNYDQFDDDTVAQYIYHCNAQAPSGEVAFRNMTTPIGWAKEPMIRRVSQLPVGMPMSLLYGSRSWVDSGVGWQVKFSRTDSYVDVQVIKGAGHHLFADKVDEFNNIVNRICRLVDQEQEQGASPFSASKRRRTQSDSALPLQGIEHTSRPSEASLASKTASSIDVIVEEEDVIPDDDDDDDDEYIPTLNFGDAGKTDTKSGAEDVNQ